MQAINPILSEFKPSPLGAEGYSEHFWYSAKFSEL